MKDRIILENIRLEGRHGVHDEERAQAQPFEVDVELVLDLQPAGTEDDLERTVDYGTVYELVRAVIEDHSFQLLETIAETIAQEVLRTSPVEEVGVRVRKPEVQLGGPLNHAAVEIWRRRPPGS